jgi:Transposase DDE domain group 1
MQFCYWEHYPGTAGSVSRGSFHAFDDSVSADRVVLDMDESSVHGQQEGSAYNGHFESVCYHPLFLFNNEGDSWRRGCGRATSTVPMTGTSCSSQRSNVSKRQASTLRFEPKRPSPSPRIYQRLEHDNVEYAIRIPAKKTLELEVEDIPFVRGVVRVASPDSWTTPRRVVAKVEHDADELFPRVGFIVTNMTLPSRSVVRFYNKRGTAEQWIKEGKQAAHCERLSCHRFRANEVRQLGLLAGGRLITHARYYWLLLAEVT